MRSSLTPETKSMYGMSPSDSMRSMLCPGRGLPMMVRRTSRSLRNSAIASSKKESPLSATSAEAVVMSWPGLRATCGNGVNNSGSTPTGTRRIRSRSTPMSLLMSLMLFSLTTTMRGILLATFPCISTKEYQRFSERRRFEVAACVISNSRSRVMG